MRDHRFPLGGHCLALQIYSRNENPCTLLTFEGEVARPVHPDKDMEAAVSFAEAEGWRYVPSSGHAWGRLFCPGGQPGDCKLSVWSTPRNAFAQARDIAGE
jgi:hypothetical protein